MSNPDSICTNLRPCLTVHVNVRLQRNRGTEWRQVQAFDLKQALLIAERMKDVQQVYEASYIPGGVIT